MRISAPEFISVNQIPLVSQDRIQQDVRDPDRSTSRPRSLPAGVLFLSLLSKPHSQKLLRNPESPIRNCQRCNAVG